MPGVEPASFRDPEATVFLQEGRIFRGLSTLAAQSHNAATDAGLIGDLVKKGWLVDHWEAEPPTTPPAGVPHGDRRRWPRAAASRSPHR